jgi:hypothetical protein
MTLSFAGIARRGSQPTRVYEMTPGQRAWVTSPSVGVDAQGAWLYLGARTRSERVAENGDVLVECLLHDGLFAYDITIPGGSSFSRYIARVPWVPARQVFKWSCISFHDPS